MEQQTIHKRALESAQLVRCAGQFCTDPYDRLVFQINEAFTMLLRCSDNLPVDQAMMDALTASIDEAEEHFGVSRSNVVRYNSCKVALGIIDLMRHQRYEREARNEMDIGSASDALLSAFDANFPDPPPISSAHSNTSNDTTPTPEIVRASSSPFFARPSMMDRPRKSALVNNGKSAAATRSTSNVGRRDTSSVTGRDSRSRPRGGGGRVDDPMDIDLDREEEEEESENGRENEEDAQQQQPEMPTLRNYSSNSREKQGGKNSTDRVVVVSKRENDAENRHAENGAEEQNENENGEETAGEEDGEVTLLGVVAEKTPVGTQPCPECRADLPNRAASLTRHIARCHPEAHAKRCPFVCKFNGCKHRSSMFNTLKSHVYTQHGNKVAGELLTEYRAGGKEAEASSAKRRSRPLFMFNFKKPKVQAARETTDVKPLVNDFATPARGGGKSAAATRSSSRPAPPSRRSRGSSGLHKCNDCGVSFTRGYNLTKHRQKFHEKKMEREEEEDQDDDVEVDVPDAAEVIEL